MSTARAPQRGRPSPRPTPRANPRSSAARRRDVDGAALALRPEERTRPTTRSRPNLEVVAPAPAPRRVRRLRLLGALAAVLLFGSLLGLAVFHSVLVQGQHAMPVTAGLYSLNGQWVAAWHLVSAGSIVAALPPVAMFFLMQRHFIAGLTLGATKG